MKIHVALIVSLASFAWLAAPVSAQDGKAAPPAGKAKKSAPMDDGKPQAPASLPGDGLKHRDFLFTEQYGLVMHIVRDGRVAWSHVVPGARGALQEATLLSNGHILYTNMSSVYEIDQDKKMVWQYEPPRTPRTEIHTVKAIGTDRVMFIQNGAPARVIVMNKLTNKAELEFEMPVAVATEPHMQSRRAYLTDAGTLLVAQTDMNKVIEYNQAGKQIWSAEVSQPWSVQRLKNGNTLVCSFDVFVRELNPKGETVWELFPKDMPGYVPGKWCVATRLSNGNTLVTNFARWSGDDETKAPVQAFEVNPAKEVTWALRSWKNPAFGAALTVQYLDEPGPQEHQHFGEIK